MDGNNPKAIVDGLKPVEVVRVAEALFELVYSRIPHDAIRANADAVSEVQPLIKLAAGSSERRISAEDDAVIRPLLLAYAADPKLEPFLLEAWEEVRNADTLSINPIVTLGLIINLTLVVATTTLSIKKDVNGQIAWEAGKGAASPELVVKVIDPLLTKFGKIAN
ncbi:hypothetical protein [Bradyrhizobium sp. Ce-3]|uniref:hypothetical protein n=1 Tax=Bradyrhizobium sp. Ce-3 TaxID=2913970 RepID=UPI001FBBA398|nr:hypothetical protein [Bradyrhizobium sp. Ce-3]GKQ50072.1 hypothetical protein BRSPCE3_09270 [Bradyrhizobium sp. Ce-3]